MLWESSACLNVSDNFLLHHISVDYICKRVGGVFQL